MANSLIPYNLTVRAETALSPTPLVEANKKALDIATLLIEILSDPVANQIVNRVGSMYDGQPPFSPPTLAKVHNEYWLRIFPSTETKPGGYDCYLFGDASHKNSELLQSREHASFFPWNLSGVSVAQLNSHAQYLVKTYPELTAARMKAGFLKGLEDNILLLERCQEVEQEYRVKVLSPA